METSRKLARRQITRRQLLTGGLFVAGAVKDV